MTRTITNPSDSSSIVSSVIRSELQTLENEIASGTDPGHLHSIYAPTNSPTFTGTPVLPTGTTGTTQSSGDASTKLATTAYVDNQHIGYVVTGVTTILTPADATTYYFGSAGYQGSTSQGYYRFRIPKGGTLVKAIFENYYSGTQPTTETSTIVIQKNGSDATNCNGFHNEINGNTFTFNIIGVTVSAGDSLEMKWTTPTWATNPGTSILIKTTLYIE